MRGYRGLIGAIAAALVIGPSTAFGVVGDASVSARDQSASVIARYRERIPALMEQQHVPGLAVALVERERPLWVQGFGQRDDGGDPVTADTVFGAQSMSKLFTATAVTQAVAAGRLDLDAPITRYLPGFTVHSAFEQHPGQRITLRMLLSHTTGLTQEAPVGNNNDLDPGSFDAHARSISETWLRFPVGTGYAYSNLGIDLAGYILERVEGKPFADVMHDLLLDPLGMDRSTFDRTMIRSTDDRAVGNADPFPAPPVDVPMTAAGGLYTSAADLAQFLRFELSDGSIDGRTVLDSQSMKEMRTVPAPHAGAPSGYALGVKRHRWNRWDQRPDLMEHGGGGYGFLSDVWWLPRLGIGVAVLTNADGHDLQEELALSILADLLTEPGPYRDRLLALPSRPPAADPPDWLIDPPPDLASLVTDAAMVATGDQAARWGHYAGTYRRPVWGYLDPSAPPDRFVVEAGVPYFEADDPEPEALARHRLSEVEPGLFLADNGETLDLRGPALTWRNLRLVRVSGGPAPWQWAILGMAATLAAAWLFAAAARVGQRRRSRPAPTRESATARRLRRIAGAVATLTALLAWGTVGLIAAVPGLVDSGYLGQLELATPLRVALHLPLTLAVLGACMVALVTSAWVGRWWSPAVRLQYSALAVATIGLVVQMGVWRLIGW